MIALQFVVDKLGILFSFLSASIPFVHSKLPYEQFWASTITPLFQHICLSLSVLAPIRHKSILENQKLLLTKVVIHPAGSSGLGYQ